MSSHLSTVIIYLLGRPGIGKSTILDYFRSQKEGDVLQFRYAQVQFGSGTKGGENELVFEQDDTKLIIKDTAGFRNRKSFLETIRLIFQVRNEKEKMMFLYILPADRLERLDVYCCDFLAYNFKDSFMPIWSTVSPLWDSHYFKSLFDCLNSDYDIPRAIAMVLEDFSRSCYTRSVDGECFASELEGFRSLGEGKLYDFTSETTAAGIPDRFIIFDVNPIYKSIVSNVQQGWITGEGPDDGEDSPFAPLVSHLSYEGQINRVLRIASGVVGSKRPDVLYEHCFLDPGKYNYGLEGQRSLFKDRWAKKKNRIAVEVKVDKKTGAIIFKMDKASMRDW